MQKHMKKKLKKLRNSAKKSTYANCLYNFYILLITSFNKIILNIKINRTLSQMYSEK